MEGGTRIARHGPRAMAIRTKQRLGALLIAFVTGALVALGGARLVDERYALDVSHGAAKNDRPRYDLPKPAPDPGKPSVGIDDADILLYVEAVTQIKDKAIALRPDITRAQIVEQSLRAYLARQDPCCAYLTREEYHRFKESLSESYIGIGMDIKKDRDGRTICFPHPESPAARAGIVRGSELRSIDGVRVDGKSIFSVAAMARGKPGTVVTVAVTTRDGREREFRLERSAVARQSVSIRSVEGSPIIVLSDFTRDTRPGMTDALKNWQREIPIILDLRGNGGGDLHAAIDSAMLIIHDHKILGVGLGNFREVARQIYADKFFRPPHNSVLWAQAEGGIFVLLCYIVLFAITWRDLRIASARAASDPELAALAMALRTVFGIFLFFSLFADLWLNPLSYLLIGLTVSLRMQTDALVAPRRAVPIMAGAGRRAA
jgi:hypothetical protein